jgi:gas vesicle protein
MKRILKSLVVGLSIPLFTLALTGLLVACAHEKTTGEKVEDKLKDAADAVGDAVDDIEDAAKDIKDDVEDTAKDAKDKIEEAAQEAEEDASGSG